MRYPICVAALLFMSPFAAQADSPHIDKYLESCIAADSTTAGMTNCTYGAYALWDKELNVTYKNLMSSSLSPSAKLALRNSQRQWLAFRNTEFEAIDAMYKNVSGTMYIPMRVGNRLEILKARVLQLQGYRAISDG
jgi:uncharacterized protein YecT (DUF1311 family)